MNKLEDTIGRAVFAASGSPKKKVLVCLAKADRVEKIKDKFCFINAESCWKMGGRAVKIIDGGTIQFHVPGMPLTGEVFDTIVLDEEARGYYTLREWEDFVVTRLGENGSIQ